MTRTEKKIRRGLWIGSKSRYGRAAIQNAKRLKATRVARTKDDPRQKWNRKILNRAIALAQE